MNVEIIMFGAHLVKYVIKINFTCYFLFFNVATRRVKITLCGLHIYVLHVIFLLNGDVVDVYLYIQGRGFRSFNGYMEHTE